MAINKKKSAFEEVLSFTNLLRGTNKSPSASTAQKPSFLNDYTTFKWNDAAKQQAQQAERDRQQRQYESDYRKQQFQQAVWKPLAKAQEFIQNKFAIKPTNLTGTVDITNLPKFKFGERAVEQQKTLPKKILAGVTLGTAESILNIPSNVISGGSRYLSSQLKKTAEGFTPEGQAKLKAMSPLQRWAYYNVPTKQELGAQAQLGEGILDAFIVKSLLKGAAKPVVTTLAKEGAPVATKLLTQAAPTFWKTVWTGAKTGGKYGAALTFLQGLQQNENAPTVVDQTMRSLQNVPVGTAVGMAFGGTLAGSSYAVNKVMNKALNTAFAKEFMLNPKQTSWTFTPEQFMQKAQTMGDKDAIAQAEIYAEMAKRTNTDIAFSLRTISPNWVGTKLGGYKPGGQFSMTFIPKAEPIAEVPQTGMVPVNTNIGGAGAPLGGVPPVEPVPPQMPNVGPLGGAGAPAPAYAFRTEPQAEPEVPTTQIGITSAQPASPITAQTLQQGNDLFAAGKVDEALNTLRQVTESTRPQLEDLLKTGGVEIVRLETGSHGLYFGTPEPTYWLQVKMPDLTQGLAAVARFGKAHGQESFITAIKSTEDQPNSRPGLVVDFGKPLTNQEFLQIQQIVNNAGLGLTLNQGTGEGVVYNIPDFDSLDPAGFTQKALEVTDALQGAGMGFSSGVDFFDTRVYYNKDYDNLISTAARGQTLLGGTTEAGAQATGGLQGVLSPGGGNAGNIPTQDAITAITGEPSVTVGTEGVTPTYASQPAVYNIPSDRAEKLFRELFSPDEVKFLIKEEGKIFNDKGQIATGKYADSLVEVVEKAGKVQDKTIYHEAFHAYTSKFANPALYQEALNETKQKYHFKDEKTVNEKLADDFADWYSGKKTFTGRILAFFQEVLNWVKSLVSRRSAITSLFQEAAAKKRYARPESSEISYQELTAPNAGGIVQRNLTTKVLQTILSQGGADPNRVVSSQYILNLTNNPAMKQVERDLIRDTANRLATDGKINVSEFINQVQKELMPLQSGETESWENIVLPDEVRGDVSDYKARVYEAPFDTEAGNVHFRGDDFPRYLAHVRAEDMGDSSLVTDELSPYGRREGGTRRIIELQSDLFQRGRFEKEIPGTEQKIKDLNNEVELLEKSIAGSREDLAKYQKFIDVLNSGVLEKEGFITPDFDAMKGGTGFWDNFKDWKATTAQEKLIAKKAPMKVYYKDYEHKGDMGLKDYLEAKYGVEHSMWNYLPDYGSKELLINGMNDKLNLINLSIMREEGKLKTTQELRDTLVKNPPTLSGEEQQKAKWLNAYKNIWFERIIKEEIAKAATDKKDRLRFPTGDTIARIEGYVDTSPVPQDAVLGDDFEYGGDDYTIVSDDGDYVDAVPRSAITNEFDYNVAVEEEIQNEFTDKWDYMLEGMKSGRDTYIPFELDVLISRHIPYDELKVYKANPAKYLTDPANKYKVEDLRDRVLEETTTDIKSRYKDADDFAQQWTQETGVPYYHTGGDNIIVLEEGTYAENFRKGALTGEEVDPESLSDDQQRVYNFYEKDIQKFLKKIRPDLKTVTDEQGITWLETAITEKDLKQPIEAYRTEKGAKAKPVKPQPQPMETMEDFREAMRKLGILKNFNVEAVQPPVPPEKTNEELALETLNKYRGYTPTAPETIQKLPDDAKARVEQLDDIKSEFAYQSGQIDDVLRNYDFYTKRFKKLMSKSELKALQGELKKFSKQAEEQIWDISKEAVTVEKPQPTDQELSLNALNQLREAQARVAAGEQPAAGAGAPPELPPTPPPAAPPSGKAPDPFGKDVQQNVESTLRNKAKIDATPIQTTGDQMSDFKTIFAQMIGEHNVAETIGTEVGEKFTNVPWEKGMNVIMAREEGGSDDPQIDTWVKEIGETYDELYNLAASTPGIDLGYWENYMTHIWDKPANQVKADYQNFKLRFQFENEREIPTYKEGLEMGLKPRFTHPAQIIAFYTTALYKTMANIKAFKALQDAGIVVPASEGARIPGYVPVDAPGVKRSVGYTKMGKKTAMVMGNYYAPKDIADILNRVYSPPSPSGMGKILAVTAPISAAIQDLRLSGGMPFTPLNAWTFGQLIREMTTAVGGLPLYPIASAERAVDGLTSTLVSIFPKASMNFFKKQVGQIKKMQARDIPMQSTYTIDNLLGRDTTKKLFGDGFKAPIGRLWKKAIFEATFRRFLPMQMIKMFNHIEAAAIRAGKNPAAAADIAAEAIKKYHGVITSSEQAMRSKATQDALTTFLFAPHYRQTMWRVWKNAAQATFPFKIENGKVKFNNPFSMQNRSSVSFLFGTILTIVAWNLMNLILNGKPMSENPPGTEDKLLVPLDDGTTLGIPFLPSVATLPRAAYRVGGRLLEADMPGVAREGRSFLSMGLVPWLDVAYNSDYYGRDIYNDNDTKEERFTKIGAYLAKQYQHPWIEASVNQLTGKYPVYQNISTAMEAPLRFYTTKSLNARYYYDNIREQRGTLTPAEQKIWDTLYKNQVFDQDDGLPVYDKRSAMANALNRLAYPNVVRAETEAAMKTAQEQGVPVNPFYLLSPDQQFVVLQLKSFYPGEDTYKTIRNQNQKWLTPYYDAVEKWKAEMVNRGIFDQKKDTPEISARKDAVYTLYKQGVYDAQKIATTLNGAADKTGIAYQKWTAEEVGKYIADMPYPEPSPELQAKLDYYNTLPYGTGARSRYLRANPDIVAYFELVKQRTNDSRLELGLPVSGSGGGGYGGGWGSYNSKPTLKKFTTSELPQLKLSGPKSSAVSLKLKPLTSNVQPLKLQAAQQKYTAPLLRLSVQSQMPQTLAGLGR